MPSLVQAAHASATGSSLSVSFASNITPGNSVIVCVAGDNATATGGMTVSPASGTDSFNQDESEAVIGFCSIWSVLDSAGGYKTINIQLGGAGQDNGITAWIYESPTLTALDKVSTSGTSSASSTFTSGATATTTAAAEFWVGIGGGVASSASTATGPGGNWTNEAGQDPMQVGGQFYPSVSGYQYVSSTGTATYSGTLSSSAIGGVGACVATYKYNAGVTLSLPVARITAAAYPLTPSVAVPLPAAQVTVTAYTVSSGTLVFLPPPASVTVTAYPPALALALQLPAPPLVTVAAFPAIYGPTLGLPTCQIQLRAFPVGLPLVLPAGRVTVQAYAPYIGVPPPAGILRVLFGSAVGSGVYLPGTPGGAGGPGGPLAPGISPGTGLGTGWEVVVLGAPDYATVLAVIPAKLITGLQFAQQLNAAGSGTVTLNMDDPWWGPGWQATVIGGSGG